MSNPKLYSFANT